MPSYSQETIQQVIQATDIVELISQYVPLKKRGNRYVGCCPFHNETQPSFSVDPDKKLYYCFGCNAGGNVFHFIMEEESLNFPDAVKFLANKAGIVLPEESDYDKKKEKERNDLYKLNELAANFFYKNLKTNQKAVDYVKERKITPEMIKQFAVGYAPDDWRALLNYLKSQGYSNEELVKAGLVKESKNNYYDTFRDRLVIPILNPMGKVIAFGARKFSDEDQGPKYLNSPDTLVFNKKNQLFNLNNAKSYLKEEPLILVEGYMDVIALFGYGVKNTAAALGTAFTKEHVKLISYYTNQVILCFDGDSAGEKATLRALNILEDSNLNVKVLRLPGDEDPDSFINKYGLDEFRSQLSSAQNSKDFLFEYLKNSYNLDNSDELAAYTIECCKHIKNLNAIEKNIYTQKISNITGVSKKAIEEQLESLNPVEKTANPAPVRRQQKQVSNFPKRLEEAQKIIVAYVYKHPEYITESNVYEYMLYGKFYKWIYKRLRELNKVEPDITLILDTADPKVAQKLSRFLTVIESIDVSQIDKATQLVKYYYRQREAIRLKSNLNNTEEDQKILFSKIMEFKKAGLTDYE